MVGPLLLLVEDEGLILDVLETGLSEEGFMLLSTTNAAAALAELDRDAQRFNCVLTDVRLGKGPTGWDVAHQARRLIADMPVVYITGDSAHEWSAEGVPNSVVIQKPFVIAQVVTAITTLINARNSVAANEPPTLKTE